VINDLAAAQKTGPSVPDFFKRRKEIVYPFPVPAALGVEKLFLPRTEDSIKILMADSEIRLMNMGFQFIGWYAMELRKCMKQYGWTKEHFAKVVEKNSYNGSLNPNAQHRIPLSVEQVLNSRLVAEPLTLYMCASMSDGAAAAVLCSKNKAKKYTRKPLVELAPCCPHGIQVPEPAGLEGEPAQPG